LGYPIVQIGQQDLEVERDLILLQVALSAQGFGVNGIAGRKALGESRSPNWRDWV